MGDDAEQVQGVRLAGCGGGQRVQQHFRFGEPPCSVMCFSLMEQVRNRIAELLTGICNSPTWCLKVMICLGPSNDTMVTVLHRPAGGHPCQDPHASGCAPSFIDLSRAASAACGSLCAVGGSRGRRACNTGRRSCSSVPFHCIGWATRRRRRCFIGRSWFSLRIMPTACICWACSPTSWGSRRAACR